MLKAYSIIAQPGINSYEHAQLYNDALYNLYKNKDVKGYIKAMQQLFEKMGTAAQPSDFGKAAQNLYNAAAKEFEERRPSTSYPMGNKSPSRRRCSDGQSELYCDDWRLISCIERSWEP